MYLHIATEKDIPYLIDISKKVLSATNWGLSYDEEKVTTTFKDFINGPIDKKVIVIATNEEGEEVGCIALIVNEVFFSDERVVHEPLFHFSGPESFRLLCKAGEEWAKRVGAKSIILGSVREMKFYNNLGYNKVETFYKKDIV